MGALTFSIKISIGLFLNLINGPDAYVELVGKRLKKGIKKSNIIYFIIINLAVNIIYTMDNNLQPFSSCQICFLCQSILQHDEPTKEWKALSCNSCEVTVINPIAESINNAMYGYSISEYRFEQTRLEINNTRIINILRKYKLSGKVLDVGCGYGLFSLVGIIS